MRHAGDRRNWHTIATFPLDGPDHEAVLEDRRSGEERRINDMAVEDRQTQLSEMPGIIIPNKK